MSPTMVEVNFFEIHALCTAIFCVVGPVSDGERRERSQDNDVGTKFNKNKGWDL